MSLSVLQSAAQTYSLIWRQRALVLRFALVPWLFLCLAWVSYDFLSEAGTEFDYWHADLLSLLATLLVLPLAIQCCRLTALGPDAVRHDGFYRLGPEFGKVAALVIFWFLLSYLVEVATSQAFKVFASRYILPAGEPPNGETGQFSLDAVYLLAYAVFLLVTIRVALRLLLVFPGLCLGRAWELRDHWLETRGKVWSLLGLLIATTLPVVLLMLALQWGPGIDEFEAPYAWPPTVQGILGILALAAAECFYEAAFAVATTVAFVTLRGAQAGAADSPPVSPHPA